MQKKTLNTIKTVIGAIITAVMFIVLFELLSGGSPALQNTPNDWDTQVESLEEDIAKLQNNVSQIAQKITPDQLTIPSQKAEEIIKEKTRTVVTLIKEKGFYALADYVHPTRGVRFSPYSNINTARDLVFSRDGLKTLLTDKEVKQWGFYDGSGAPIDATFADYYEEFIYDHPYHSAPQIGYNQILGKSNGDYNLYTIYPNAIIVEYHFPGFDERFEGMDWKSLRIVYQEKDEEWYIVGIVHDQWTI
jgi:outer membrane murein-binding lipoprotein Lpp